MKKSFKNKGYYYLLIISVFIYNTNNVFAQKDIFGITEFYPTKPGTIEWNSNHWNNGISRTIKYASDPYDPTDWTEDHSASTIGFIIDGNGTMKMAGSPRFHINPEIGTKVTPQKFTNIEFTAYYMKKGLAGSNWGGMIVGMRGSANGHGSSTGNDCDAQCYQARFRNDGKWDFEKEIKHSATTYFSGSGFNTQDPLWGGLILPENRWIGMKYILTNINSNTQVHLQVYIDSTSNGNVVNGGNWVLVGDIIDTGTNWIGGDISGCTYTNQYMALTGGGNVYMRTDGDTANYKMITIREIDPNVGFGCKQPNLGTDGSLCGVSDITLNSQVIPDGITTFEWFKDGVSQGVPSKLISSKLVTTAGVWKVLVDSLGKCSKESHVTILNQLPNVNLGSTQNLCNPSSVNLNAGINGNGINYTWTKDSKVLSENTSSLFVTEPGTYGLSVSASNCTSKSGSVSITSSLPIQHNDTICKAGIVNTSVTGTGDYYWYNAATGGTLLGNAPNITQSISANTLYYVEDKSSVSTTVGPTTALCTGVIEGAERTDMQFIAYKNFKLKSVKIVQGNYGGTGTENFIVEVWTDNGSNAIGTLYATGATNTLTKPTSGSSEATLQVNIDIVGSVTGTKYWLQIKSSATLYYLNCAGTFPYNDLSSSGGIVKILQTKHDGSVTTNFGSAYNWAISIGTSCARTIVKGIIDPLNSKCGLFTTQSISLQQGWNLISTNVHTIDSSITTLFLGLDVQEIKNNDIFWSKGQATTLNKLKTLTSGQGYLVKMNTSGNLVLSGTPLLTVNFQLLIKSGWNLIGCPFQTATPFSKYFNATNAQTVKNFDGFWLSTGTLNSITNFEPGKGYFLKASSATNIQY
jgi:hypothetical protein